ncbi:MAG: hypothetical protein CSA84_01050 [Actinomycetales bacterium]|nr:MAG: hypothetical protein CSA84_01050 [Actinomycetales bacterium]
MTADDRHRGLNLRRAWADRVVTCTKPTTSKSIQTASGRDRVGDQPFRARGHLGQGHQTGIIDLDLRPAKRMRESHRRDDLRVAVGSLR